MATVLQASGVSVDVGGSRVLADVDLTLEEGEMLALVGPNGAGKSTLLSVLSGDRPPVAGVVALDGVPLSAIPVGDRARRRSVLTQSNHVAFPFPVAEVVRMGRAPWRRRPESAYDDEAVRRALDAGEIEAFVERPITALSGGERARVAFARSHAQSCAIALLDEPTASLDIRHQHRVLSRTRMLVRNGGAAIVVLHDLALAAAYADRVALLAEGRIVSVGAPRDVFDSATLSRIYRHPIRVWDSPDGGLAVIPRTTDIAPEHLGNEEALA